MFPVKTHEGSHKTASSGSSSTVPSQALEWVWHYLQDRKSPHVLDCGAVSSATVRVLTRRAAKVYVADLVAPVQSGDPAYWRRVDKRLTFCLDEFLARLPKIPSASLSLICCWHLLDLIPGDQLPELLNFLLSLLGEGGILFCFLREPNLDAGMGGRWWLESLTTLGAEGEGKGRFPYPALSNREVERLTAGYSLKTFLTRSHRREVIVLKRGEI
jgi:Methyltransferase domain